jgi:hypothetical protein
LDILLPFLEKKEPVWLGLFGQVFYLKTPPTTIAALSLIPSSIVATTLDQV